ncbi:MAG: acyltransferase [Azoarcus sp.]|nr:acyltransferase [Azoarcus sp.]
MGILILTVAVFQTKVAYFPGKSALWPVLGAALVIMAGFGKQLHIGWLNRRLLSWRPVVAVGLISYPLYLWHWPLLSYTRIILGEMPHRDFRIILVLVAFVLATLTYFCVERPIRFGRRVRGSKTIALLVLLTTLGGAGGWVYVQKGIETRGNVVEKRRISKALEGIWEDSDWAHRTRDCREKFNLPPENIPQCLYHASGPRTTILLIGDSHAHSPFDAIAEYNAKFNINTLFLHTLWTPIVSLDLEHQKAHLDSVLNLIKQNISQDISKVFIIERGVLNLEAKDIDFPPSHNRTLLGEDGYYEKMQYFVDLLRKVGKEVFIVSENPVLYTDIRNLIHIQPFRPIKNIKKRKPVYKSDVLKNQEKYLNVLKRIQGATIIYSLDAFCPTETCLLTDENGLPLYADDDHLSRWAGGRFLVDHVLKPYLAPKPADATDDGTSHRKEE